jgi:hypothetical protein
MSIFCFGLSHQTAAVDVRERFAIPESALPEALARLKRMPGLTEASLSQLAIERNFMPPESSGTARLRLFSRASIEISGPATKRICSAYGLITVFVTYFE